MIKDNYYKTKINLKHDFKILLFISDLINSFSARLFLIFTYNFDESREKNGDFKVLRFEYKLSSIK